VKITNPARGQLVVIGRNLTLSGTASYNDTSSCGVFVIVDGVRPYQKTTPIGETGGNESILMYNRFVVTANASIIESS